MAALEHSLLEVARRNVPPEKLFEFVGREMVAYGRRQTLGLLNQKKVRDAARVRKAQMEENLENILAERMKFSENAEETEEDKADVLVEEAKFLSQYHSHAPI